MINPLLSPAPCDDILPLLARPTGSLSSLSGDEK